jgi:hypothetical protein
LDFALGCEEGAQPSEAKPDPTMPACDGMVGALDGVL